MLGKLLEALKRLMGNLPSLRRLELIDLMLDNEDAQTLLDQVCFYCCTTLNTLILVNTTKHLCQLLHPGVFINLQVKIDVIELHARRHYNNVCVHLDTGNQSSESRKRFVVDA